MKRIFIDMDGVLVDLGAEFDKWFDEHPNLLHKYKHSPDHIPGIFRDPKPYDGAIEGLRKLEEKYDVWILTKPSTRNLNCYTEKAKWIYDHFGQDIVDKLIICPDKALLKGDYLIDDKIWSDFEGEQLHFLSDEYPDWKSVVNYLMK